MMQERGVNARYGMDNAVKRQVHRARSGRRLLRSWTMSDRPSQLWKGMPPEKRVEAAEAFWRDTESQDIQAQHVEALVALAKRLNFRMRTLQALPVERRA